MGRGRSKAGAKNSIGIKNPANIPSNAITLDEFYTLRGVGSVASGIGIDQYGGANMTRMSQKARQKAFTQMTNQNAQYYAKRAAVRQEYQDLINKGVIRDKTTIEKTITAAHGNPNNAARKRLDVWQLSAA